MLTFQSVSFSYNGHLILDDINVSLQSGELIGVIGANGAGKSTFIQLAAGLLTPRQGTIHCCGDDLAFLPASERAKKMAYLPQSPQVDWPLTVKQIAGLGRLPHQNWWAQESDADVLAVANALLQTDMTSLSERRMDTLSGGERLRAMIARMVATQAELWLADEPLAALDILHQLQIVQLFKRHCADGGSAVMVVHDLNMAARFCDKLLLLHHGKRLAFGAPDSVLTTDNVQMALGVVATLARHDGHLMVHFS